MEQMRTRLEALLFEGQAYLLKCTEGKVSHKPSESKWSKKEVLGHLIDSGINNLQRFTEIQYEPKPYVIRKYNQDELVKANRYQDAELKELLGLWMAINGRILQVIDMQTNESLDFKILVDDQMHDLWYLIEDYTDHMHHHLKQIMREEKLT